MLADAGVGGRGTSPPPPLRSEPIFVMRWNKLLIYGLTYREKRQDREWAWTEFLPAEAV